MRISRYLIAVACAFTCAAVTPITAAERYESGFEPGTWALQFGITDKFSLSSFEGGRLSLRRHFVGGNAFRFGVGLESTYEAHENMTNDFMAISAAAQYLRTSPPGSRVRFYYGLGPQVAYDGVSSDDYLAYSLAAGLGAVIGAEWVFRPGMSIHGEYLLVALYTRYDSGRGVKRAGYRIGAPTVGFGVSMEL